MGGSGPRRLALPVLAAALVAWFVIPASARAACPSADPSYFGACGPAFTTPAWGDGAGWGDPSKFSTIQLADVNGDGKDELLGRGDAGIEIWTFDTSLGQWRPQVDANAIRQVISDFRSPTLSEDALGWKLAPSYLTIQTANVDGAPGEEVIGRGSDGMRAYRYKPPAGRNSIDGGTWERIASGGPYPDRWGWADAAYYLTIRPVLGAGRSHMISHESGGLISYGWTGGGWGFESSTSTLNGCASENGCVTSFQVLPDGTRFSAADPANNLSRSIFTYQASSKQWTRVPVSPGSDYAPGPFSDIPGSGPDCPSGGGVCFAETPALLDSVRWANLDFQGGGPALIALLPDGLQTVQLTPGVEPGTIAWEQVPSDPVLPYPPNEWSTNPVLPVSLTVANLDGQGGDELVALNDGQLQPYRYDSDHESWVQMNPTTPVTLNDPDVWGQPEHYWTFRAGDVDGDGRDEIIARGAYGIRTWFYDRRGTGGWERYLPPDYPGFTGGQADAFAKLTELAKAGNYIPQDASSVRSVWTLENPPTANDLSNIHTAVQTIAQCTGSQSSAPPRYEKCILPAGATFSVADWTAVVNEVFAEIYAAQQVLSHFSNLDSMRTSLFIGENAELPAIGSELGLQVAANTKASFDQQDYWTDAMQIMGSIAGIANPAAGAALSIAGDIVSMVPSAAPTLMSAYQTTYAGVETQFANAIGEADKAAAALSQTVRQDYSLLNLVAQLREQGTWQPDLIGVESAANQAFAGWVYQSLLPAVYDRYEVTYCLANPNNGPACVPPSKSASYPGVIGQANGPTFTALSAPPQKDWTGHESVPCGAGFDTVTCSYPTLPQPLANLVFGPVSPGCDYQPGNANTAWTFGCNLGLSAQTTVGAAGPLNGWNFTSWTADPGCVCGIPQGAKRTHAVGWDASVRITDVVRVPRGFQFARARAVPTRVLFEPLGRKELAGPAPFVSRPADRPRGARKPRRPRTRVRLRRLGPTKLRVDIRTRRKGLRVPQACQERPYSLQPRNTVVRLETRLRLSDGRRRRTRVIRRSWRCERDRTGKIMRLRLVNERRARALRHGLRSRIMLPRSIRPGARMIARLRVTNARRRGALRHVVVTGSYVARGRGASGMVAKRIAPLGAGRSRTVRLRLRVPRTARGRLCVRTTAIAALAHDSTRRACTAIRQPTKAHRLSGLGRPPTEPKVADGRVRFSQS